MGVNGVEDAAAMCNINANAAAGIAGELKAARVLFLTVTFATDNVKLGVKEAFIIDGRVPHALFDDVLANY
eukprot:scaffold10967_cov23-Cyclotella_meneghiniana.AAC.1